MLIVNINTSPRTLDGCRGLARAFRSLDPALDVPISHWARVDRDLARRLRPGGVVLGPNETPFPAYPAAFDAFLGWVRGRRGPTLGICGGHQALALAHGAPIGPVHPVPAAAQSYEGMPRVDGAYDVRLLGDPDPLLEDLPVQFPLQARHVDEVKEIPRGFRLLAIGDPCHIQMIRADRRPLYGVQGHPELPASGAPGRQLLLNFLALLG